MPADQPNFDFFTYESGDGTTYNLRAETAWAAIAAHGLAAATGGAPRYIASRQQAPRKAIYRDLTTGRSKSGPVGTSTDFDALSLGDTQTFHVPGLTTGITYTLTKKVPEKIPTTVHVASLPDHA